MFSLLRPGDYIRWNKIYDEGLTAGAAIEQIGIADGKKNWRLRNKNNYFSIYWENLDYVYLKKHPTYILLEEKINILSSSLAFIVKTCDIEEEFSQFNNRLNKVLNLRRTKSLSRFN